MPRQHYRFFISLHKNTEKRKTHMSIQWLLFFPSLILAVRSGNVPMRAGAPFRIALFADLHFGEDAWTEWGPQQDLNSVRVMSDVLDKEKPDYVIYLGDVITANNIMTKNASSYWDQALSPTRERGIPWSTIFGNHDDSSFEWPLDWFSETGVPPLDCPDKNVSFSYIGGTTRLELAKTEIELNRLSHTKHGPRNLWPSVSNYVLSLSSSGNPMVYMYFLDSGGGSYPEVISNAQVKWFKQKSEEVNPDSRVSEIIFWHIPSEAYGEVAPKFDHCVGSIFSEEVAAQEAEMGIMDVIEKRASVKAVFVGHNHGLDWCCPRSSKLWLCFARHTGYGGYGDWARGARIVEVNEKPFSIKSWIRMEDGDMHSEVIIVSHY